MFHKLLDAFEAAYRTPEAKTLLTPRWRAENEEHGAPPSTGHCYIAAEAAYHMLRDVGLEVSAHCASYKDEGKPSTHWWVEVEDWIVDPTATQYTELGEKPPYHLGRCKGFLTIKPSKRAAKLMKLVQQNLKS